MSHYKQVTISAFRLLLTFTLGLFAAPSGVKADEPGRGLTAEFEIEYLKSISDHHFSALRMTELAAGTDPTRNAEITPKEGTAPSPGFASTPAKASLEELKSLARRNNQGQREEILTALHFLREWYGIEYQPTIRPENQAQIADLEAIPAGAAFDVDFMENLSRHHFMAVMSSAECLVASELKHTDLVRYCRHILNAQLSDIDEMRHLLCNKYDICDYQPLKDPEGDHS